MPSIVSFVNYITLGSLRDPRYARGANMIKIGLALASMMFLMKLVTFRVSLSMV